MDDLSQGLPLERAFHHTIKIEAGTKLSHRPICQLSPADLLETKKYVEDLLHREKIRPRRSPFGTPLLLVKQNGKLIDMMDRALNRITNSNNIPIPCLDEMFGWLGRARYFSNLDLKSSAHQIRMSPEYV